MTKLHGPIFFSGAPGLTLELQLSEQPPYDSFGLLLGVVRRAVNQWGGTEPGGYTGSGRIGAVG